MLECRGKVIRVGARSSKLSLIQANNVIDLLSANSPQYRFELVTIKTIGDADQSSSLITLGGRGVFVKELEVALLGEKIDIAVHSAKDLPSILPEGTIIAAVPKRAPVEDALISINKNKLADLPGGTRIATGSPRRRAMLKRFNPDFLIVDVRGNIDTRLNKLEDGQFDAIILARAGIERLGMCERITEILPPEEFLPAPGQGALAIEIRSGDEVMRDVVRCINSPRDYAALTAERSLLAVLQAGCSLPVGAWARWNNKEELRLDAIVLDTDGKNSLHASGEIENDEEAEKLGEMVAQSLLSQGAGEILSI